MCSALEKAREPASLQAPLTWWSRAQLKSNCHNSHHHFHHNHHQLHYDDNFRPLNVDSGYTTPTLALAHPSTHNNTSENNNKNINLMLTRFHHWENDYEDEWKSLNLTLSPVRSLQAKRRRRRWRARGLCRKWSEFTFRQHQLPVTHQSPSWFVQWLH